MPNDTHDLDDSEFRNLAREIGLYDDVPTAEGVASGLSTDAPGLTTGPRGAAAYRGWYGNRWCPKQSKFGARGGGVTKVPISPWLRGDALGSNRSTRLYPVEPEG